MRERFESGSFDTEKLIFRSTHEHTTSPTTNRIAVFPLCFSSFAPFSALRLPPLSVCWFFFFFLNRHNLLAFKPHARHQRRHYKTRFRLRFTHFLSVFFIARRLFVASWLVPPVPPSQTPRFPHCWSSILSCRACFSSIHMYIYTYTSVGRVIRAIVCFFPLLLCVRRSFVRILFFFVTSLDCGFISPSILNLKAAMHWHA